jgi:hypothetical protein
MTHHEEPMQPISDEEMASLLNRTVRRGTHIRRRQLALRTLLIALAICVVVTPISFSLAHHGAQNGSTHTAISTSAAGPFEDVVWKHVDYPGVNFSKITYPGNFGCNPGSQYGFAPEVQQVTYIRAKDSGTRIALVLVRCNAGTPAPSSLYAFTSVGGSSRPHLLQTLLAAPNRNSPVDWYASNFSISKDSVVLPVRGTSGDAPVCCPNVSENMRWTLTGDRFTRHHAPIRKIPPFCLITQLKVGLGRFGVATGHIGGTANFTNTSSTACTLTGYPHLQMLDATGKPLPTEINDGISYTVPSIPVRDVTLIPGSEASFDVGFDDATGYGTATCPQSTTVEITPPNATLPLSLSWQIAPFGGGTIAQLQCGQITVSPVYRGSGQLG